MQILRASEDYLEAMLMLQEKNGYIRSIDVAELLKVSKPSVSNAAKRLREGGYITMDESKQIALTDTGMEIAQRVYDRHKLLTDFLMRMGVDEAIALEDACKMEHSISDATYEAICRHTAQHTEG